MAKPMILAVDDDPQVLRAVERDLRRDCAREYRVLRTESGHSALETLEKVWEPGDPSHFLRNLERLVPVVVCEGAGSPPVTRIYEPWRVVGRHKRDIRVVSEPGDGTCMEVRLTVDGMDGETVGQPRSAERVWG